MIRLIEGILIAVFPTPSLVICPFLFSVSFASTLSMIAVVLTITVFVGGIALVTPLPSFILRGIRDFSQAEIIFPSWSLLGNPQDVSD